MTEKRDYFFYRKHAGLDFDKFIELNPDKNGEELFKTFMVRYDIYYKQRDVLCRKYEQRMVDEQDEEKFSYIEAEKMFALAQLEEVFIDVLRVMFGLAPDDENAKFGKTVKTRYNEFVMHYFSKEQPGFYKGADGLYRLPCFYADDTVPLWLMKEYYLLGDKVYRDGVHDKNEGDIEIYFDGKLIMIPDVVSDDGLPLHLKVIEKLMELEPDDKITEDKLELDIDNTEKRKEMTNDEIVDEYFK